MATVDGITVAKALEIEGKTVVSATIDGSGNLILTLENGTTLNAGNVSGALDVHMADKSTHGVSVEIVGTTETQTLYSKTLIVPFIASFANANHDHSNSAGGGPISTFSGVKAERTATQSIPDSSTTLINFSATAIYDTNSYRTSGTLFTIPETNYYDICAVLPWDNNAGGRRAVDIRLNDTSTDASAGSSLDKQVLVPGFALNFYTRASVLGEYLTAGDTIKVFGYQNSGGALNVLGNTAGIGGPRTTLTIKKSR
jgi:hypothetical protein